MLFKRLAKDFFSPLAFETRLNLYIHALDEILCRLKAFQLMTNSNPESAPHRSCLYEIVGVTKSATTEEIKKAYRVRALQCHPDKDPSPEAKLNFQKLAAAYSVLKDAEGRALYDETGYIEGDGFDKAADFFRTKFGRISEDDIVAFESKYKGSLAEREDVIEFYQKHAGDISSLLEWIPLSEPDEADRFLTLVVTLISESLIPNLPAYPSSIAKLKRNAKKMKKEQEKFTSEISVESLALSIKNRAKNSEFFFQDLIDKYSVKKDIKKLKK